MTFSIDSLVILYPQMSVGNFILVTSQINQITMQKMCHLPIDRKIRQKIYTNTYLMAFIYCGKKIQCIFADKITMNQCWWLHVFSSEYILCWYAMQGDLYKKKIPIA